MKANQLDLKSLLPRGTMAEIAGKLGITTQAVGSALKTAKPSHPAVREAMRIAEESGALATAQKLAALFNAA
jgi:predicted transcriptional regulator